MPKGSATTLFVSSTCYDLAQVRADLRDFAEAVGFEPILSELDSFPVNPSQNALANCLEAVRTKADVFLLIVGGRYGSLYETGKSITNLEYVEAEARRLPKYVFVKSDILALLPIWRANPTADFSSAVDSPKLFEFISSLRDKGEVWVFPFGTAQDIVKTLRKQLSFLFSESLSLRAKIQKVDHATLLLNPDALQIFVERPMGWEYLVFAQLFKAGIASHRQSRLDLELGITFDRVITLQSRAAATQWVAGKVEQMLQIVNGLSQALNGGITKAVGVPGGHGDVERIQHVASRLAKGYLQAIEWTLEFHRLRTDPQLDTLMRLASELSSNMLLELDEFSQTLFDKISHALANHQPGDKVQFTLDLAVPNTTEIIAEMQRIARLPPEE